MLAAQLHYAAADASPLPRAPAPPAVATVSPSRQPDRPPPGKILGPRHPPLPLAGHQTRGPPSSHGAPESPQAVQQSQPQAASPPATRQALSPASPEPLQPPLQPSEPPAAAKATVIGLALKNALNRATVTLARKAGRSAAGGKGGGSPVRREHRIYQAAFDQSHLHEVATPSGPTPARQPTREPSPMPELAPSFSPGQSDSPVAKQLVGTLLSSSRCAPQHLHLPWGPLQAYQQPSVSPPGPSKSGKALNSPTGTVDHRSDAGTPSGHALMWRMSASIDQSMLELLELKQKEEAERKRHSRTPSRSRKVLPIVRSSNTGDDVSPSLMAPIGRVKDPGLLMDPLTRVRAQAAREKERREQERRSASRRASRVGDEALPQCEWAIRRVKGERVARLISLLPCRRFRQALQPGQPPGLPQEHGQPSPRRLSC